MRNRHTRNRCRPQVMVAKWHLLKLTIQTAPRKMGGTTRGSSGHKPLRADNPHDVQTKLSLQQKQCISGKAFQGQSQTHAYLPGNKAECEVSAYSYTCQHPLEMHTQGTAQELFCPAVPSFLIHPHSALKQTHQKKPTGRS